MVAGGLELFGSGFAGEGDFNDGKDSFLTNFNKTLLARFVDINSLFLGDCDDLVKTFNPAPDHFGHPERSVNQPLGGLDRHEVFVFTKEEGEGARNVFT